MKKYVQSINEFFSNLSEEEKEEQEEPKDKTPEEEEEEREQDADDLARDYNIYDIDEPEVQLEFYNELIEGVTKKLGISFEGPFSTQSNTVAKIGDKTPLNLNDWDNVYYRVYDESENPDLYLELITDPDALEKFMDENGSHWPHVFIHKENKGMMDEIENLDAEEQTLLQWMQKEFD